MLFKMLYNFSLSIFTLPKISPEQKNMTIVQKRHPQTTQTFNCNVGGVLSLRSVLYKILNSSSTLSLSNKKMSCLSVCLRPSSRPLMTTFSVRLSHPPSLSPSLASQNWSVVISAYSFTASWTCLMRILRLSSSLDWVWVTKTPSFERYLRIIV